MSTEQAASEQGMRGFPVAGGGRVLREVRADLGGRWWKVAVLVLILTAGAATGLVAPFVVGRIVDLVGREAPDVSALWVWAGVMVFAALAGAVLSGLGMIAASRLYEHVIAALRERMMTRMLGLPQRIVESTGSGDLVSRATNDVAEISQAAPRIVPTVTRSLFTIAVSLLGLAAVDLRYVLAVLIVLPVHVLAVRWYLRNAPEVYATQRRVMAEHAHHLLTSLQGIETIHAYRLHAPHRARIARASWQVVRWEMLARIVQNRFFGRLTVAEVLGVSALLLTGFLLIDSGLGSVGGATTAILLFIRLFNPINGLLIVLDDVQSALASLARIVGVISMPAQSAPFDQAVQHGGEDLIRLEKAGFAYRLGEPVLDSVSLGVGPRQTIALVGSSGAGKSTVAALLAGVFSPTAGQLTLGGSMAHEHGHPRIALITQETHVFAGTLRENLTLAAPDSDDERLMKALGTVGAFDLVGRLPSGLDSPLGGHGHALTSAESQLLALARLVLAAPDLAILDEATAEAGSTHADRLETAAQAVLEGRGGVVVAHRLTQARACDRILVMDGGRVVEEGSHEALLARDGQYAALWRAWEGQSQPRGS